MKNKKKTKEEEALLELAARLMAQEIVANMISKGRCKKRCGNNATR
jgi:hypothetical protein